MVQKTTGWLSFKWFKLPHLKPIKNWLTIQLNVFIFRFNFFFYLQFFIYYNSFFYYNFFFYLLSFFYYNFFFYLLFFFCLFFLFYCNFCYCLTFFFYNFTTKLETIIYNDTFSIENISNIKSSYLQEKYIKKVNLWMR